jgi:hypothetical protein
MQDGVLDVIHADLLRCGFPLRVLGQFEFVPANFGLSPI